MQNGAKKQLLSGMVYIALAVTVVAVGVSTIAASFSKNEELGGNGGEKIDYGGNYRLELPQKDVSDFDISPDSFTLDTPVSDLPSGVGADVSEPADEPVVPDISEISDVSGNSELQAEYEPETGTVSEIVSGVTQTDAYTGEEPADEVFELGYDGYLKPCAGYVCKEFSLDVPVYSATMYDYRTHGGIDIACETGSQVKACSNGVISEIYSDYLYGTTVKIEHSGGIVSVYSNLSAELPAETAVGKHLITGEAFAGVGNTALCESAEVSHLHFEMLKDGVPVNPSDYLEN